MGCPKGLTPACGQCYHIAKGSRPTSVGPVSMGKQGLSAAQLERGAAMDLTPEQEQTRERYLITLLEAAMPLKVGPDPELTLELLIQAARDGEGRASLEQEIGRNCGRSRIEWKLPVTPGTRPFAATATAITPPPFTPMMGGHTSSAGEMTDLESSGQVQELISVHRFGEVEGRI